MSDSDDSAVLGRPGSSASVRTRGSHAALVNRWGRCGVGGHVGALVMIVASRSSLGVILWKWSCTEVRSPCSGPN